MIFLVNVAIAVLGLVAVTLGVLRGGPQTAFLFGVGAAVGELWIFVWALACRARRLERFDMLVAAELLIAYGIFSLLLGLFIGLIRLRQPGTGPMLESLPPELLSTFAGGLFGAGLATLLSAILRQIEVLLYPAGADGPGGGGDFSSMSRLSAALERATGAANELTKALGSGAAAGSRLATDLDKAKSAATDLGPALQSAATASRDLKEKMGEGATLLGGTARLIESVNSFLRPGAAP